MVQNIAQATSACKNGAGHKFPEAMSFSRRASSSCSPPYDSRSALWHDGSLQNQLFHVTWKSGWPAINKDDLKSLIVGHAPPGYHPFPIEPERDEFSSASLGLVWNVLGPTGLKAMSLTERPGFLRLHGQAAGISFHDMSALVGRRQTEWNTVSTVRLEFQPKVEDERAGLSIFMSPRYHYDISKVRRDGRDYVQLVEQVSDIHEVTAEVPVAAGPLLLRIESTALTYSFSFAVEGGAWVHLGSGDQRLIASEVADVWSGAYLAMFSESKDGNLGPPADFDWFDYKTSQPSQRR